MAKETMHPGYSNPYFSQATEALKDLWGYQWKATQSMLDHGMKLSQTMTEYYYTSVNEGVKIAQDAYKGAVAVGESTRKDYADYTEKAFKVS